MKKSKKLLGIIGWIYIIIGVFLNVRMFYIKAYPTYLFFILTGIGIVLIFINEIVKKHSISRIWQFSIGVLPFVLLFLWSKYSAQSNLVSIETQKEISSEKSNLQNGDIIFQISTSSQSEAIQLATNSKYSHMGIIYDMDGEFFVYEAIQPVQITPLKDWIRRGKNAHYVVKRLINSEEVLTESVIKKMKKYGQQFKGRPYDIYFEWSDDKIYCSELVWKIYKNAGNIEIGQLQKLSEFDLTHKAVKNKMEERYGANIPLNEKVISPGAMFESDLLMIVKEE